MVPLVLTACDSSEDPEPIPTVPSMTGSWAGIVVSSGVERRVQLQLNEVQRQLTGAGTVETPQGISEFTLDPTSSHLHPLVNIFLVFATPPPGSISGNLSDDGNTIRGTMSGPGVSGVVDLTLQRVALEEPQL